MADSQSYYPPVGFHFRVDFGFNFLLGRDVRFREVSGLSVEVETKSLEEGGENRFAHKLPLRQKHSNLVLKRGLLVRSRLVDWIERALVGSDFRPTTVVVSLLDEVSCPQRSWVFVNAWPVKWTVSDFNAQENGIVIETLELAYSYFWII